jgi:hypothetical protein
MAAMEPGLASWWRQDGGLDLPNSLSFEAWEELGGVLVRMEKGIMWAIGDWLQYGERRFGDRAFQAVVTGYATGTLRAAAWVAHRFPRGERDPDVPWSHYRELASLPEEQANDLLAEVKAEGLSQKELRTRVQATKSRAVLDTEQKRAEAQAPAAEPGRALVIADPPWELMTLDDLCKYDPHAASQSVLFLWAPVERLTSALAVVHAWGYLYASHLVWPASREASTDSWVDIAHELVLVAHRGELYPQFRPRSMMFETLAGTGRQERLHEIVADMYPDLPVYVAWPVGAWA